jgi:hypothetical protein
VNFLFGARYGLNFSGIEQNTEQTVQYAVDHMSHLTPHQMMWRCPDSHGEEGTAALKGNRMSGAGDHPVCGLIG